MSVRIRKTNIIMTRGDTLNVEISLTDKDGNPYEPTSYDTLRFALKKNYDDAEPLISVNIPTDTMTLRLEGSATKTLEQPGEYVYDIELTMLDGTVDTVIPKGRLIIEEEVD